MKHFMFVLAVVCMCCANVIAQESCEACLCVADNTCDNNACWDEDSGCATLIFTCNCSGNYYLKAKLFCSSSSTCGLCYACAELFSGTGTHINSWHTNCEPGDCEDILPTTVSLTYGLEYKLKVCLRKCPGEICEECYGCTARAYLYYDDWSACDVIPACNP